MLWMFFLKVSAWCLCVLAWVNVSYYTICEIMCARLFYVLVHDLFVKMRNSKISLFSFICWLYSNLNENCFKTLTYNYSIITIKVCWARICLYMYYRWSCCLRFEFLLPWYWYLQFEKSYFKNHLEGFIWNCSKNRNTKLWMYNFHA